MLPDFIYKQNAGHSSSQTCFLGLKLSQRPYYFPHVQKNATKFTLQLEFSVKHFIKQVRCINQTWIDSSICAIAKTKIHSNPINFLIDKTRSIRKRWENYAKGKGEEKNRWSKQNFCAKCRCHIMKQGRTRTKPYKHHPRATAKKEIEENIIGLSQISGYTHGFQLSFGLMGTLLPCIRSLIRFTPLAQNFRWGILSSNQWAWRISTILCSINIIINPKLVRNARDNNPNNTWTCVC